MTSTKVMGGTNNYMDALLPISSNTKSGLGDFKSFLNLQNNKSNLDAVSQPVKTVVKTNENIKEEIKTETPVKAEAKEDTKSLTENREVEEGDVKDVKETVEKVVDTIEDKLDVSEEEVLAALEELGLQTIAVLNPENISDIVVEVKDIEDPILLATDEDLLNALNSIEDEVKNIVEDICKALDIDPEEFSQAIETFSKVEIPVEEATGENEGISSITEELLKKLEVNTEDQTEEKVGAKLPENLTKAEEMIGFENEGPEKNSEKQTRRVVKEQGETPVESFTTVQNQPKTVGKTDENTKEQLFHQGSDKQNDNVLSFAENLIKETVEALNENPENVSFSTVDASRIINQITESIKTQITAETTEINMKLHPETLGNVNVRIVSNNEGALTARFIAENEAVKSVIEAQAVSLKESLESKGVTVEAVEVMVGSHRFDESFNRERSNENNNTSGRKTVRRINLSEEASLEEIEDESDDLTREMMRQNGNTIDYTA